MDKEDILAIIEAALAEGISVLDLSNRDITELPAEIGKLENLKLLNLSYNSINQLPAEISKLTKLESLLLSRNELEELPPQIGKLERVKLLDLSHNPLKTFPEEIGNLSELLSLDASYCKIERLPIDMIELLTLKDLYLDGNECQFPPQSTIKMGLYATMHFLSEEKRKQETKRVTIQVFNLPYSVQSAFSNYIEYFNDIFYASNQAKLNIDTHFINNQTEDDVDTIKKSNFLEDFLSFIKGNLSNIGSKDSSVHIEMQLEEINRQITKLTKNLATKIDEIDDIRTRISEISKSIKK